MIPQHLVKTCVLIITLLLARFSSNAQLQADFSSSIQAGCAPIVVQFNDQSTGNPNYWQWDLGNGTISYLQNPSVTYFNPGTYSVKLVVRNANGQDTIVKTQYITVYALPQVDFGASSTTGCSPLTVQFEDMTNNASGTIDQWYWDFGDGLYSTDEAPFHTYTSTGSYNVSLWVMNSVGCSHTITKTQFITVNTAVVAGFSHSVPSSCFVPSTVQFQNSSTGSGNLTYAWDFGDGSTSTDLNPQHTYTSNGSFTVTLVTTNEFGCSDTFTRANTIVVGNLQAAFTHEPVVCAGTPISFQNNTVPLSANARWDFGDGTTSTSVNPSKTYSTPGTYTIQLIAGTGSCSDTVTSSIIVMETPTAGFTATNTQSCSYPLTVQFQNTSANAISYSWDFGDGSTSTVANPSHTYTAPGSYTVSLTVTSRNGCTNTFRENNLVKITLPSASIVDMPQEGCSPLEWTFTPNVTAEEPVANYWWDFGNGTTSTDENPTVSFTAGTYDITLAIMTQSGCTDTITIPQAIRVGDRPLTGFFATPQVTCAKTPIIFTDTTVGVIDRWLWDFGDNSTSVLQNPEHKYRDTGTFDITLIVWSNGCVDTLIMEEYITIQPPIAKGIVSFNCNDPFTRKFVNRSIGADMFEWTFDDGSTSTEMSPIHTYGAAGTYRVQLVAFNNETGCSDTTMINVSVYDISADFTTPEIDVCKKAPIPFTALDQSPNIVSYQWNFGDGGVGNVPNVQHSFQQNGSYTVSLIVAGANGCRDTVVKTQVVNVAGPTAGFTPTVPGTCNMSPIEFTDNSESDGTHPITSWAWNYGDGTTQTYTGGPFIHTYNTPGQYTVELTVTDSRGCTDKLTMPEVVRISRPNANFSTPDTLACLERQITFNNHSSGPSLSFVWDFGDGNSSTVRHPVHEYQAEGTYTVKLFITDMYGCKDSITKTNYVNVVLPVADFVASDTIGSCPPLVVQFTNNSRNATSWSWDFGDNTSGSTLNPSHFYATPGVFNATLNVQGPGGCTSSKSQTIYVSGPQGSFSYDKTSGCDPLTVTFTASTMNRVSFLWDFSDGNTIATTDSVVTHIYTTVGNYLPKMLLMDASGCIIPIVGPDTIRVGGIHANFTSNATVICDSGYVQFNSQIDATEPIVNYTWTFGDGGTSNAQHPQHHYNTPGVYNVSLEVESVSGCSTTTTSTTPIIVSSNPKPVITQSANGCAPLAADLFAELQNTDTTTIQWQWILGNGQTSTNQQIDYILYEQAGVYNIQVTATNGYGCVTSVQSTIEAYAIPTVSAGNDGFLCYGVEKQLQATGADYYEWSPAIDISCVDCPNPVVTPSNPITYTVIGTTIHGCKDTAQVSYDIAHPFNIQASRADSLCDGQSLRLQASGAHHYRWYPSTGLNRDDVANPIASPRSTTNYMVVGYDNVQCFTDTLYVPITVFPQPQVDAGADRTINVGHSIDLVPTISPDVTEVTWSPTGSIFRSDYPSITVKPNQTTTYTVEAKNAGGCVSQDNITIHVICTGANVFIPNTFSPNGDGSNDVFYPRGTGLFQIKSMKIFNRWGELVYQRNDFNPNDASKGWDGTYKGKQLGSDVYVYVIEIMCDNNTVLPFKGDVTLLR